MKIEIGRIFDDLKGYNMTNFYDHVNSYYQVCIEKKPFILMRIFLFCNIVVQWPRLVASRLSA